MNFSCRRGGGGLFGLVNSRFAADSERFVRPYAVFVCR